MLVRRITNVSRAAQCVGLMSLAVKPDAQEEKRKQEKKKGEVEGPPSTYMPLKVHVGEVPEADPVFEAVAYHEYVPNMMVG